MATKKTPIVGVRTVKVDMAHWSSSVAVFKDENDENGCLYGYDLLKAVSIPYGHGIELKVTVEVLDKGKPCPVRKNGDKKKCSKR